MLKNGNRLNIVIGGINQNYQKDLVRSRLKRRMIFFFFFFMMHTDVVNFFTGYCAINKTFFYSIL